MREYELTYLISDEVAEKDLKKITDRVAGMISDQGGPEGAPFGGKVSKEEVWGRRKLTYPIKKQNFATYVTVWFELPKEKITDIEHELRVHPQIIRHLIVVKVAKGKELVVTKEDIVGTEDVKEVLGEKSFEIVEGKTEESRDLMAKREKEETKPEVEKKAEEIIDLPADASHQAMQAGEKPIVEKPKKKTVKKVEKEKAVEPKPVVKEVAEKPVVKEKAVAEKPADLPADASHQAMQAGETPTEEEPKEEKKEDEADRIKKLDEKLDELLKDDL